MGNRESVEGGKDCLVAGRAEGEGNSRRRAEPWWGCNGMEGRKEVKPGWGWHDS